MSTTITRSTARSGVNPGVAAPVTHDGAARPRHISPGLVAGAARGLESAILLGPGLAIAVASLGLEAVIADCRYALALLAAVLATTAAAHRQGGYAIAALQAPLAGSVRLCLAWSLVAGLLALATGVLPHAPTAAREALALWYAAGIVAVVSFRYAASHAVRHLARQGRLHRRAVIYGAGEDSESLLAALEADPSAGVAICGIFDDRGCDRVHDIRGYRLLGNIDQLVAFCRATGVDLLIVSLPMAAETRLLEMLAKLRELPIDVRLAAHSTRLRFRDRAYSFVGKVPLIDLSDRPLSEWDSLAKSALDKVVAMLALIVLSPVMVATALAIRLESRGPVLFRQKRLGFNNEVIEVLKFRSMFVEQCDADAARLAVRGDPRITRIGRLIRRTSIDELPQLFNVLGGTLSLVGPRPHALQAKAADCLYHHAVDGYFARHRMKPGITGWAQIHGWRGETDTKEKIERRVAFDLHYIENWSLLLDLYILAKTPLALLRTENAY